MQVLIVMRFKTFTFAIMSLLIFSNILFSQNNEERRLQEENVAYFDSIHSLSLSLVFDTLPVDNSDQLILVFIWEYGNWTILEGDPIYPHPFTDGKKYLNDVSIGDTVMLNPFMGFTWYELMTEPGNFTMLLLEYNKTNSDIFKKTYSELKEELRKYNFNDITVNDIKVNDIINRLNNDYILKQWKLNLDYVSKCNWLLKYP